ncbi:adenylosuccinate lyase, partial [Candidatus Peribacteria bacterium]|nr:adenylosuccinate lyase [Candidatus Peribacteria bacterium]
MLLLFYNSFSIFNFQLYIVFMQPLSPLDGRYSKQVEALRPFFTEEALMRARIFVELSYFAALADEKGIPELKALTSRQKKLVQQIVDDFDEAEAAKVREIEKKTNHDVKAIEYYLRNELTRIGGAKFKTEFLHFALTSEDVNNLAYGILIHDAIKAVLRPELTALIAMLHALGASQKSRRMLSLTHGQPATPTTLGKEIEVFVERITHQRDHLSAFRMQGKFGGAVGNYFAHESAYPNVNWRNFGKRFVKSLGLLPLENATQINPHDDLAELSHVYVRINTILIGLCRD